MDRQAVHDFLVSRRARITPEQAGMPTYGEKRRVPGLRREEVATLAGVSFDYYARLERGNLSGVSDSVVEALARALQLDEAERQHLFDLAKAGVGANFTIASSQAAGDPGPAGRAQHLERDDRHAGVRAERAARHPGRQRLVPGPL